MGKHKNVHSFAPQCPDPVPRLPKGPQQILRAFLGKQVSTTSPIPWGLRTARLRCPFWALCKLSVTAGAPAATSASARPRFRRRLRPAASGGAQSLAVADTGHAADVTAVM